MQMMGNFQVTVLIQQEQRPRAARIAAVQSTQVVSQGRHHHHSRLIEKLQPWWSGLNAPAGSPQNRHRDPWTTLASIHPVEGPAGSPRWRAGRGFFEANEATRRAAGG
jgi:hypothetical protein